MEIKKIKGKSVLISSKSANVVVFANALEENTLNQIRPDIVLSASYKDAFSITGQGEYETKECWIMSLASDQKNYDHLDVFIIEADEIRIAVLDSSVKELSKKFIEKLGLIDIIIADLSEGIKEKIDIISEIEPRILIPVNTTIENLAMVTRDLGVKSEVEEKKLKIKVEDFENPEYQLELVKLVD